MIVRNVVRSVVRDVVRSVVPLFLVQRYFTKLESALNSYYSPTSTPAITRLVMDVYPSNGNGNAGLPTGAPAVADNVFQTIDFSFVGNLPDIGRNGAVYFDGYIGPVKAYNGTTLVGEWDMNGAPDASYEVNKAATLGSELVVNGTFDTDITGWSDTSSAGGAIAWNPVGAIDLINTTGTSRALQDIVTEVGKVYKLEIVNTSNSNGSYEIGSVTGTISANSTTVVFYTATSTTTDVQLKNFNVGTTVTVSTITLQEIPASTPYLIRQNIATEQTENFTLYTDVSPNEWRNDDNTIILPVAGT